MTDDLAAHLTLEHRAPREIISFSSCTHTIEPGPVVRLLGMQVTQRLTPTSGILFREDLVMKIFLKEFFLSVPFQYFGNGGGAL